MEQSYLIYTDVSTDISPDFAKENDIHFIPMNYSLREEDRLCSGIEEEDILKRFYDGQRHGDMTRTSQITPQIYEEIFRPVLEKGISVLYLCLSGGLSSTYNSSCLAAKELNEKFSDAEVVSVDTLAATAGMGLLLEKAVENRRAGMSIRENAKWLEENRLRVCHWFMVEDLMYLKRGGRVSGATAALGTALNIRPILKIENDGTLQNFTKARGTKNALRKLVEYYASGREGGEKERIYIVHADSEENAAHLEEEIRKINPTANITKMMLCPIIGAHVGPGMCAIVHWGKRNFDEK